MMISDDLKLKLLVAATAGLAIYYGGRKLGQAVSEVQASAAQTVDDAVASVRGLYDGAATWLGTGVDAVSDAWDSTGRSITTIYQQAMGQYGYKNVPTDMTERRYGVQVYQVAPPAPAGSEEWDQVYSWG